MSLARLVVTAVMVEGRAKAEVARTYGLSRTWVHELIRRYEADGEAGLAPRSRRPRSNPRQIDRGVEGEIVALRKQLADQGLDAGAATIAAHLHRRHGTAPATATIWRILSRRGFVTPQPQKRPKASLIRFAADQPNERWQADTTHWHLADSRDVEILNIIDDHSRLAIASHARATFKAGDVVDSFDDAFCRHGLPASVLTDNGAVFTAGPRGHGQVALERHLAALHIRQTHSRAYHPQTCGKVERFHQTLKRWLTAHDACGSITDLQARLDAFVDIYNTQRPHRALGRRTPSEAWHARPRATPTGGLAQPHCRVRRDIVNSGRVTLRYNSRLHHIGLGHEHNGTRVLILAADRHIRVITRDGQLVRELELDPTRDYQPRGVKPGPKPRQT